MGQFGEFLTIKNNIKMLSSWHLPGLIKYAAYAFTTKT